MLEKLQNRPEAREAEHAKQHRKVDALDEKRPDATSNSEHEKHWPALHAEVVFSLNDDRVEEADAKEGSQAKYDTVIIHSLILAAKVQKNRGTTKDSTTENDNFSNITR